MEAARTRHCCVYIFITHRLTLTLQLHNFNLFRTCRASSFYTVAWQLARFQLTRRIARSFLWHFNLWSSYFHVPLTTVHHMLMTNYELLRWLVETPSRDIRHYGMLNMSAVDRSTFLNVESSTGRPVQHSKMLNRHVTAMLKRDVTLHLCTVS